MNIISKIIKEIDNGLTSDGERALQIWLSTKDAEDLYRAQSIAKWLLEILDEGIDEKRLAGEMKW